MDEKLKMESKLQSAAAFVEGGIQDACDDSCSICLEDFCESDPSTMTSCKHEFHLQCVLEWCQRSSQCPMCWQPISLKDPTSQELFEGVENERKIRSVPTRSPTIFRHPTLGDIELPHLQDNELEERIIQHLAAAAAMGRTRHIARREGQRSRSGVQQPPQFMVFSTQPNTAAIGNEPLSSATTTEHESSTHISDMHAGQAIQDTSRANVPVTNRRLSAGQTTPVSQDRAGPSDLQSFADSLKSRLNAVSMRYKDTIAKNTRGWKERLFSRNTSVSDVNSEARRDVNAGIASISGMMDHMDLGENKRASNSTQQTSVTEQNYERPENNAITSVNENNAPTSSSTTTPVNSTVSDS